VTREQILWLAVTLLVAAIVAPLAKIFWDFIFQKKSNLIAILQIHSFRPSQRLKELLTPGSGPASWQGPNREKREWQNIQCFSAMTFKNRSRKRINGITVMLVDTFDNVFYQVDQAETGKIEKEEKINVGDLQPNHSITILFWSQHDWSAHPYLKGLKKKFVVSADELDKVTIKMPMPGYLSNSNWLVPSWIVNVSLFLVWFALMLAGSAIQIKF
jgi:hypothetical protein